MSTHPRQGRQPGKARTPPKSNLVSVTGSHTGTWVRGHLTGAEMAQIQGYHQSLAWMVTHESCPRAGLQGGQWSLPGAVSHLNVFWASSACLRVVTSSPYRLCSGRAEPRESGLFQELPTYSLLFISPELNRRLCRIECFTST